MISLLFRFTYMAMRNLYNSAKDLQAILTFTSAVSNRAGNHRLGNVFPDYTAPIVRNGATGRELVGARWGMPSPQEMIVGAAAKRAAKLKQWGKIVDFEEFVRDEPDYGVPNVETLSLHQWLSWQGVENRCLVPATAFAELHEDMQPGHRAPAPLRSRQGGQLNLVRFERILSPLCFRWHMDTLEWGEEENRRSCKR
ncbi:hypothetical protein ABGN05_29275 [Aquibium sp. LZ166]|uniref:Uncharacterized protein n=1 Tax=Aquibium pacificus TaxID=3153579 RepID=A0ABV3SSE4_9HYPH